MGGVSSKAISCSDVLLLWHVMPVLPRTVRPPVCLTSTCRICRQTCQTWGA